jgi:hypothetical protein
MSKLTIKDAVCEFVWDRYYEDRPFTAADLTAAVRGAIGRSFSPESAVRKMREARADGRIFYAAENGGFTATGRHG